MVIVLGRDQTIPRKWGSQLVWWWAIPRHDYEWRFGYSFLGYFR